jgi:hypothetical protein
MRMRMVEMYTSENAYEVFVSRLVQIQWIHDPRHA